MKIAVAADGDKVSLHFGRCSEYRVFSVEDGKVARRESLKNPGHEPGVLPKLLADEGVDVIIAGGMEPRAEQLLKDQGIKPVTGVLGPVEEVVEAYLKGTLKTGPSSCEHQT